METKFKFGDRVKVVLPTGRAFTGVIRGRREFPDGLTMEPEYDVNYREDNHIYIMMRVPEHRITNLF